MKKALLFLSFIFASHAMMAQCSDLFISEYLEGYASNKAIEIYNPTSAAIDLSAYALARFSNGSTDAPANNKILSLPEVMLESYETYVVVLDKRNMDDWNTGQNKPVWNGFNVIDTLFDAVTGEPQLDDDGNIRFGPQYIEGNAIFGDEYNEEYDLQCKADLFACPSYEVNNVMYFNGNDAMALILGTEIATDGSNLVDVIGVIGEDPEDAPIEELAWVNEEGYWLTRDRTLVRKATIGGGRSAVTDVLEAAGGSFVGTEWESYRKNSFEYLGTHASVCNPGDNFEFHSCATGPYTSVGDVSQIPFKMYPNPYTGGVVTIEAPEEIKSVQVFNVLGQMIYNQKVETTHAAIELNQLGQGMYLVNLVFENNQISIQKLIIN